MRTEFRTAIRGPMDRSATRDGADLDEIVERLKVKAKGVGPEAMKARRMLAALMATKEKAR